MKVRNDGTEKFVGEFNRIIYTMEPNEVIEIPDGAWDVWVGSTPNLKEWARHYWGPQGLPQLVILTRGGKKDRTKNKNGGI